MQSSPLFGYKNNGGFNMFDIARIRAGVEGRLAAHKQVTVEVIHDAYAREMLNELTDARLRFRDLQEKVRASRVTHPKKGWIMVSEEQKNEVLDLMEGLSALWRKYW